jgi:osmotically-inducible protein OsmY
MAANVPLKRGNGVGAISVYSSASISRYSGAWENEKMQRSARSIILVSALLSFAPMVGCAPTQTSESTGQYVDDATITTKVKAALVGDAGLKGFDIHVVTYKGIVQLSGFVDSSQMIAHATDVAQKVGGVQSVRNDLIVK